MPLVGVLCVRCCVVPCRSLACHVMPCCSLKCCAMPCRVKLWCVVLHCVALLFGVLCCCMSYCALPCCACCVVPLCVVFCWISTRRALRFIVVISKYNGFLWPWWTILFAHAWLVPAIATKDIVMSWVIKGEWGLSIALFNIIHEFWLFK